MSGEYFDCIYNLWTGFVGKATCEAGFLRCEEMSCPAYTPKPKQRPMTNHDWLIKKTPEELARFITDDMCELLCGAPSTCCRNCEEKMLSWLKSPASKEVDK